MGDEVDEFNMPVAQQSGSIDQGHLSQLPEKLISQQAGRLNTALEGYYSQTTNHVQLSNELDDLGYTPERRNEILEDAQEERTYRIQNGHPSDLTPNQLESIRQSFNDQYLNGMEIHTDLAGRQYVDDHRNREVDGTPARFYLPPPIRFNPLTLDQQFEVQEIVNAGADVYIQEDAGTGETTQLTDRQREQAMALAQQYINSDPDFRSVQRFQFRSNVQQIEGLSGVSNIQETLLQLFVDVEDEYDYRRDNNGLPRGLTQEQYDFLRQNQVETLYNGQVILTEEDSGLQYYYSARGKQPVLTNEQISQIDQIGQYTQLDIRPTQENYESLNMIFADYLGNRITRDETIRQIQILAQFNPDDPIRDPYRRDIYNEFLFDLNRTDVEKEFRDRNDGRPSELSQLQYDYLRNHAIRDEREIRFNDQLIYSNTDGSFSYMMPNGIRLGIPSDEYINGFIEQGFYNPIEDTSIDPSLVITDDDLEGRMPLIRTDPVLPSTEQIREITSGEREFNPDDPLGLLDTPVIPPQELEVLQTELGSIILPVETGTRIPLPPVDPSTPPAPTSYTEYFVLSQEFYVGFRQVATNIITTSFTIGGAFIGYSFGVARQRLLIRNFATETEILMTQLDTMVNEAEQRLQETRTNIQETEQALSERELDMATQEALLTDEGYTTLEQFNREVGRIRERVNLDYVDRSKLDRLVMTNPTIKRLAENIEDLNAEAKSLAIDIADLEDVRIEIERNKEQAEILENMVLDNSVRRETINTQLRNVINNNYKIFFDFLKYRREILTGAGIGGALGSTLSLIMAGYTYPTAINEEQDIFIPDQYKIDNKITLSEKEESEKKQKQTLLDQKHKPVEKEIVMMPPVHNPARNILKSRTDFKTQKFIPIKDNGKKPLTQREIFELQSTLSQSELSKLKGKYLIFGKEGVEPIKVNDKCKEFNPLSDNQIKMRPVRIR